MRQTSIVVRTVAWFSTRRYGSSGSWNQSWIQLHNTRATADKGDPAKALVNTENATVDGETRRSGGDAVLLPALGDSLAQVLANDGGQVVALVGRAHVGDLSRVDVLLDGGVGVALPHGGVLV
jgi:hypothetical protein